MTTIDPAISIADRPSTTALSRHFIDRDIQPRSVVEAFPLTAFAVRDDGFILPGSSRLGKLIELGQQSLLFELDGEAPVERSSLVLSINLSATETRHAGVVVRETETRQGLRRIRATIAGQADHMLSHHARLPALDLKLFRYRLPFSVAVYDSWCEAGILKKVVLDRLLSCPKCHSVATFRFACRQCRSARLEKTLLIHHYACAWVGPVEDFETGSTMKCPNCRTQHLVAGTDFEYMPGESLCQACGWHDRELEQTGHCLNCDHRFPAFQAIEEELVGYDAQRLDALALLPQLG
jgi:hypothetical protein